MRPIVAKILKNFVDDKYGSLLGFLLVVIAVILSAFDLIDNDLLWLLVPSGLYLMGADTKLTKKK